MSPQILGLASAQESPLWSFSLDGQGLGLLLEAHKLHPCHSLHERGPICGHCGGCGGCAAHPWDHHLLLLLPEPGQGQGHPGRQAVSVAAPGSPHHSKS